MTRLGHLMRFAADRRDGCPHCLRRNNRPRLATVSPTGHGVICHYHCPDCGNDWWTSWRADSQEAA